MDGTVIPAQPGWNALELTVSQDRSYLGVHRHPVVAWIIAWDPEEEDWTNTPVTNGLWGKFVGRILERPDGEVEVWGDDNFQDIDALLVVLNQKNGRGQELREKLNVDFLK